MTKRERYLKAMRNEPTDELVWAPNFDYWRGVNEAEGTLPPKYKGMSRNDIVRAVGATLWNRAAGLRAVGDGRVKDELITDPQGNLIRTVTTPLGSIREVHMATSGEGAHRSHHQTEFSVKDLKTLRILQYVVESTHYEPNYEPTLQALKETGDDGVVLTPAFCMPFIQFAKNDAGYVNGLLMWMDHRREVDGLIQAWSRNSMEGYRILADGPADVIISGDNMDGVMISPAIFKEYAIPFYQEARKIFAPKGKIYQGHWCGRTQSLLSLVPGCGLDIVEAIVTKPMADITLAHALDLLQGKVVLQGGIPAVLVCNEGGSREDFERYMREVILPLRGRKGFILGMSDNVPPNADFARVEAVAELIKLKA